MHKRLQGFNTDLINGLQVDIQSKTLVPCIKGHLYDMSSEPTRYY